MTTFTKKTFSNKGNPERISLQDKVDIWHPINGKWVHIVQGIKHGETEYYTNGQLVPRC